MAESVLKSVLLLGKLLAEEISRLDGVRDEVKELQTELNALAAFLLDAVNTCRQDEVVRTVLSEARNIAYDCEDVIETYMLEVAQQGYEEYEGFQLGTALRWACLGVNAVPVHKIHSKIAELIKRISALERRMTSFGVPHRISAVSQHLTEPLRRVYPHEREEYPAVGLENQLDELVERLLNPSKETVIAICGMGGIGKSTLARELYFHPKLRDGPFSAFGWVDVSQQFQPEQVLRTLKYALSPEQKFKRKGKQANRLHEELYYMMMEESCLVVIDDIWTSNDWARLEAAFPRKNAEGSKVILTTRNEETISGLDPNLIHLHQIKGLDERSSWELFVMTAFPTATCTDSSKEELGREMLRHCNGVPLAIVVLAKVLKGKEKLEDWKQLLKDIHAQIQRGDAPKRPYKQVYDVLQVSYDELPFHLKHCCLHLANFPEDYEISTDILFPLWVAEGMIILKENPNELDEDVAEGYLNELVGRSVVQVASRYENGRIKTCRLHDLMRDVFIDIAKQQGFLQLINGERPMLNIDHRNTNHLLMSSLPNIDKRLRRLAINVCDQEPQSSTLATTAMPASANVSRVPNLRSLMLFSSANEQHGSENCKKLIETISSDFPLLRIFACENFQIEGELPEKVGNLIHLRYLGLFSTHVTELASSIHKLQWLQTLDLRVDVDVVLTVPNILWKMKQLRHLYLPFPGGLLLVEIVRVENAPQRYLIKGGEMLRLDGLVNLQTILHLDLDRVNSQGLSNLERMSTVVAACETNKEALYPFIRCSSMRNFTLTFHARIINEDPVILSSCEAMYKLDIHVEPYSKIVLKQPLCLEMLPKCLVELGIWYIKLADDPMPILEKLPNLARLHLRWCFGGEKMACSASGFPELSYLCFDGLGDHFTHWEVEQGALRKLKDLMILGCWGLSRSSVPDAIPRSVNVTIKRKFY